MFYLKGQAKNVLNEQLGQQNSVMMTHKTNKQKKIHPVSDGVVTAGKHKHRRHRSINQGKALYISILDQLN